MAEIDGKVEWLARVLGFRFAPARAVDDRGETAQDVVALTTWRAAEDMVGGQLRALSDHLRKTGVPELETAASVVEHVLDDYSDEITALLSHVNNSDVDARAQAHDAVAATRARLGKDMRILTVDSNPFGVPMTVLSTLDGTLRNIEEQLVR